MIKPFLNERVQNSILFHDNLTSLHAYVEKQILPEELGGKQGPFDDSAESAAVLNMSEYFESIQYYVKSNSNLWYKCAQTAMTEDRIYFIWY